MRKRYEAEMKRFVEFLSASPFPIPEALKADMIDAFSYRIYDRKGQPISIKDLQVVRRTLRDTLIKARPNRGTPLTVGMRA